MAGVDPGGSGGDPKVILLVTFVDWAKKNFVTDGPTNGLTDPWTDRLDGKNSDLDIYCLEMAQNCLQLP